MVTKNPLKEKSSEKKFNLFELKLEFAHFLDLISKPGLLEPDNWFSGFLPKGIWEKLKFFRLLYF